LSQQINLFNPAFRKRRGSSAAILLWVVGVAVLATGVAAGYEHYRLRQARDDAKAVATHLAQAQAQQEKLAAEQKARKPDTGREAELVALLAQVKRRREVIDALKSGAAGTSSGFSEYMRAFSRQTLDGVWLTGFDIDAGGQQLTLSGRALSPDLVPVYLERLNREPLMQGRQFATLKIEQPPEQPAPTLPAAKDEKAVKPKPPPALRYVSFTVSTAIRDGAAGAGPPGVVNVAPPASEAGERLTDRITSDALGLRLKPAPPMEAPK
jgi:hypothetical protein